MGILWHSDGYSLRRAPFTRCVICSEGAHTPVVHAIVKWCAECTADGCRFVVELWTAKVVVVVHLDLVGIAIADAIPIKSRCTCCYDGFVSRRGQ